MFPNVPGFKLINGYENYATSADGKIWHKNYQNGWHILTPYRFFTGEMVARLYNKNGGMAVFTVQSIIEGKPKLPDSIKL